MKSSTLIRANLRWHAVTKAVPAANAMRALAIVGAALLCATAGCSSPPPPASDYIAPAYAGVVTVTLDNGRDIEATLMQPESALGVMMTPRGVIALHSWSGSRAEVEAIMRPLVDDGFSVLLLDLRSVRRNGVPELERYLRRDATYFNELIDDVAAAKQYLANVCSTDIRKIALVGVGTGATLALNAAAKDRSTPALVLVSPGTNYLGMSIRGLAAQANVPNVLLFCAESATGELDATQQLRGQFPASARVQVEVLEGTFEEAHGGAALRRDGVIARIVDFIRHAVS